MSEFNHQGQEKKKFVQKMFDEIAPTYDLLNHILSLGTDVYWRKKLVQQLDIQDEHKILDIACGTGDVGFEILKHNSIVLINLDSSQNMLNLAREKAAKKNINNITFINSDAEQLPLESNSVDCVTIAFGIRNLSNYDKTLKEFFRVLKPGGTLGILEFSKSESRFIGLIFQLYFHHILPLIGNLLSRSNAYSYLPESVAYFPNRQSVCQKIIHAGFQKTKFIDLSFGISTIFLGYKK